MNPNDKGWLSRYCELIDAESTGFEQLAGAHYEKAMYQVLQPTGIMYGHPASDLDNLQLTGNQHQEGNMKMLFTSSLIHTGSLSLQANHPNIDQTQIIEHLVLEISDYFLNVYPDLYQGKTTSYLKNPYYLAENLIGKRVAVQASLIKNNLANLFHNSLLFVDVYYFGQWVAGLGSASTKQVNEERQQLQLIVLGTMALAAKADNYLQKEERALFDFFLQSANLSPDMERTARSMFSNMKDFSLKDLPAVDSWLLRKYIMEMAILVTWADRSMDQLEHDFLTQLGAKLKFTADEISESILAVESFVLINWSEMHYLLGMHNFETIGKRFMLRLKGFINRNKDYLVQEIRESKELFYLLGKSRTRKLTELEKTIVNEQLIDIVKTIPTFVIIALPFTFITLPVLLNLLPKSAFPSAFQE